MRSDELSEGEYLIVRTYWDRAILKPSGMRWIAGYTILPGVLVFAASLVVAIQGPHRPQHFALLLVGFAAIFIGIYGCRRVLTRAFNHWLAPMDHAELPALCAKIGAYIKEEWAGKPH